MDGRHKQHRTSNTRLPARVGRPFQSPPRLWFCPASEPGGGRFAAVTGAATEADVGAPLVSLVLNAELAVGLGRFVAKVVVVTVEESCGVEEGTFGGERARERYT